MTKVNIQMAEDRFGKMIRIGDLARILTTGPSGSGFVAEPDVYRIHSLWEILDHSKNPIGFEVALEKRVGTYSALIYRDTCLIEKVPNLRLKSEVSGGSIINNKEWWMKNGTCPKCRDGSKPQCLGGSFMCSKCGWKT